jgi:hypothetical protein
VSPFTQSDGTKRRRARRSEPFDPSLPLAFRIADNFGLSVEEVFNKTDV